MRKHNVVTPRNLPTRAPTLLTVMVHLLLWVHQPPGWVTGAAWTCVALLWVGWGINFWAERYTEVQWKKPGGST